MKDTNQFLSAVMRKVRAAQPALDRAEPSFTRVEQVPSGNYVEIWFLTSGCTWDANGGCTMCNYGAGPRDISEGFMENAVEHAIAALEVQASELMVSPSGGMLDEREVPLRVRQRIFSSMAKTSAETLLIETRAETATDRNLDTYVSALPGRRLAIEFGLESASPWISEYCVNKGAEPGLFASAAAAARSRGISVYANICLGTAFLSQSEAVEDCVRSARWALDNGADRVVLFPVHIKRFTLLDTLFQQGMYTKVSLWSLVESLMRLGPTYSHRVEIAWYKSYYTQKTKVTIEPNTCALCYPTVLALLDVYRRTQKFSIVEELYKVECPCRKQWRQEQESKIVETLPIRVYRAYESLDQLLGLGERRKLDDIASRMFRGNPFACAT